MHPGVAELSLAIEELVRFFRRLGPEAGLSLTAAATLSSLDRNGPARLTELATQQGVSQPAMTQLVTRLQDAGFAERRADPDDGRVVRVYVTDGGRAEVVRRRGVRTSRLDGLFEQLSAADREALVAALPAIGALTSLAAQSANLKAQPAGPAAQPASLAAQPAGPAAKPGNLAAQPADLAAQPADLAAQPASLASGSQEGVHV